MFYLGIWSTRKFGLYNKEFLKEHARKSPEEEIDLQFCFGLGNIDKKYNLSICCGGCRKYRSII
jgi:hypothetical protein